ncbi:hypothetical protein HGO38_16855 [Rhizobium sp. CG5]|uniref:hypothetical protein n=1 Tax=Rhizobium sp. CG5 TaxID=2726076 RepID=UPI0020338B16|nr:hypothetical protein [Rhizobium sp. CG5]MCM2475151.1 hypothetical protein [Rhizobium sp. CG5]
MVPAHGLGGIVRCVKALLQAAIFGLERKIALCLDGTNFEQVRWDTSAAGAGYTEALEAAQSKLQNHVSILVDWHWFPEVICGGHQVYFKITAPNKKIRGTT